MYTHRFRYIDVITILLYYYNNNILNPFFNLLNQHFKSFDSNIISISK